MGKLLHFEFHKLIRQKSFYICLAVAVAMLFISTYTTYLMQKDAVDVSQMGIDGMSVMIGAVSGGTLSMVIGVFVPLFVCEDYVSGTIRNIVTRGYTRLGIFLAKLIAVLFASAIMTIVCMAAGYLVGVLFCAPGEQPFDAYTVKILLCQLAVMLAEASLFYAISTVLQKTGGAIAICLVLPMVLTIVLALADTALAEKEIQLSGYWLERINGTLAVFDVKSEDMKKALLTALSYFVVTTVGSFVAIAKKEY
ncbi:MAG: ABC transporter permease [Clostridiales bacterium]|nr:ABC transporter permease [Clostridiales bacterium]